MTMRTLLGIAICAWCTTSSAQLFTATGTTVTIASGVVVTVEGDVLLGTGGTFDNEGSLRVEGDWTNNSVGSGVLPTSTGSVLLNGSAVQDIQGTAVTDFRNLIITGGDKVLLQNAVCGTPIQPDGTLTLDGAVLLLSGRTLTVFNPLSTAVVDLGGSVRSESSDLLSRFQWALGADIAEHVIPFSTSAGAALPFAFTPSAPFPAGTLVSVATYPTAPNNTAFPVTVNQQVLNVAGASVADNSPNTVDRFWLVDLPNGSFTGSMRLSYTPPEDPSFGPGPVRAQRWLESGSTWQYPPPPGQSNPATREVLVPNTVFTDAATPTNEHIWAMAYDNSPLPVELLFFTATCEGERMRLEWSTATETNSDRFVVQRSANSEHWYDLDVVAAAGNSQQIIDYTFVDAQPLGNSHSYYRLLQVDANGDENVLPTVAVPPCGQQGTIIFFPNPADEVLWVDASALHLGEPNIDLILIDATGRTVHRVSSVASQGPVALSLQHIAAGSYTMQALGTQGQMLDARRLVKR